MQFWCVVRCDLHCRECRDNKEGLHLEGVEVNVSERQVTVAHCCWQVETVGVVVDLVGSGTTA